jgi:MFS family permease
MVLPIINGIIFIKVPIPSIVPEDVKGLSLKELFKVNVFWIFMLLMMCAGACEMAVAQWASTFAEKGLGVTKEIGDLAGPAFFAVCMGTVRTLYGKFGEKVNLKYFMFLSGVLCCVSYLIISLSPYAWLGFLGCGLCGFSVGIMWPGTFSISSAVIKGGGTPMFALLALAGDLGCGSGPTFVGIISSTLNDNLKKGILAAIVFPIILIIGLLLVKNYKISTKPKY